MQLSYLMQMQLKLIINRQYSNSIIEAICRISLFTQNTSSQQINTIIKTVDLALLKYFKNADETLKNAIYDWVNIFVFNVSALNQEHSIEIQNQILQSTDDLPSKNILHKQKQSNQYSNIVRSKIKHWIEIFLESTWLSTQIKEATEKTMIKSKSFRYLMETLDYLSLKYSIQSKYNPMVIKLVQYNVSRQSDIWQDHVVQVNKKIFTEGQRFIQFIELINNQYNINLKQISEIVVANYYILSPPRPIFQTANISGRRFTEALIDYLTKNIKKSDLFSQKLQANRTYELLMHIIVHTEAQIFNQFTTLYIYPIISQPYSPNSLKLIQQIWLFFTNIIPQYNPNYHRICRYIYKNLTHLYNKADSIELMKKFILNRFLLNPYYYALFFTPNEVEMQNYVATVNSVRVLFYEKKASQLAMTQNNQQINNISLSLRTSLNSMLELEQIKSQNRGIYINDKILRSTFSQLYDQFRPSINNSKHSQVNSKYSHPSASQSQLSFSLKNDSMSRNASQINQSNIPSSQFIKQHKKKTVQFSSDSKLLPPPPVAKSQRHVEQKEISKKMIDITDSSRKKQDETQIEQIIISDQDVLSELLNLRREYGEKRKEVDEKQQLNREKRQKFMAKWQSIQLSLREKREGIEKVTNLIAINNLFL